MAVLTVFSAILDMFPTGSVTEYRPQFILRNDEVETTCGGMRGCRIPNSSPPKPTSNCGGLAMIIPQALSWADMAPIVEVTPLDLLEATDPGEY